MEMGKCFLSHVSTANGPSMLVWSIWPQNIEQGEVSPSCAASQLTGLSSSEKSVQRLMRPGVVFERERGSEGKMGGGRYLTCAAYLHSWTFQAEPMGHRVCVWEAGAEYPLLCPIVCCPWHQRGPSPYCRLLRSLANIPQLQKEDF